MAEELKQRIKAKPQIQANAINNGDVLLIEHAVGTVDDSDKSLRMDQAKQFFTGDIAAKIPADATSENKLVSTTQLNGSLAVYDTTVSDAGWAFQYMKNLVRKNIKTVSINLDIRRDEGYSIPDNNYSLCTIPEGYKPPNLLYGTGILISPTWTKKIVSVYFDTDGSIKVGYGENTDGYNRIQIWGNYIID